MISAGAGAAAAAAAAEKKRQFEEEEMTTYTPQDLSGAWEFKILRSMTGAFKNPQHLKEILEQERQAGWDFVEKFDNNRIRLKRPASARTEDDARSIDPYRTYVGPSEGQFALMILAALFGTIAVIGLIVAIVVNAR
jgi:hypothetical protein